MNFTYQRLFYEADIQKYADIINLVRAVPNDADIVYLGESSNTTSRGDDIDQRPISDFISDYFPSLKLYDITKPASHAGIFKVLLENIPEESKIKTVVVTLNLRSFNGQWIYSDLETPLQKSLVLIKNHPPLINRLLLSFKAYDIKTSKERTEQFFEHWKKNKFSLPYAFPYKNVIEWDNWMANNGIKDSTGSYNQKQTELACHYIKGYAFQIDTINNPRIKDFNDIIEIARKRNWNLVFNLMAENTEKAMELVGKDLIYLMNENRKLLKSYYESKGVTVVDNLFAVPNEQFIDQNWTTEHYAEKGRKIIAKNVAHELRKWHNKNYKELSGFSKN